jgi:hypothetical protein
MNGEQDKKSPLACLALGLFSVNTSVFGEQYLECLSLTVNKLFRQF